MLAPSRLAAGALVALALLSTACSNDSTSPISAPSSLSNSSNSQSASAPTPSLGAASNFAILSAAPTGTGAVTCVNTPPPTTIIGNVGSSGIRAAVVEDGCTITGTIVAPVSDQVLAGFNGAYSALAGQSCGTVLTGTLAGVTLTPGVYCFDAAATLTGTLTLNGGPNDTWLFKIGTSGTGALTGTNFKVLMPGGLNPCNVTWWVAEAATMTTSNFIGTILAGAAITVTSGPVGTFNGRALAKAAVSIKGGTFTGCAGGNGNGNGDDKGDKDHKGDKDDKDHKRDRGDKDHKGDRNKDHGADHGVGRGD